MKLKPRITIADHFSAIDNPRIERSKQHKLIDIITIARKCRDLWCRGMDRYRNLWLNEVRVVEAVFRITQ